MMSTVKVPFGRRPVAGLVTNLDTLNALSALTVDADDVNKLDTNAGAYPVFSESVLFTETADAGVYTGAVALPAGAMLLDIIVHAVALWDTETSATMKVGDVDNDDGFYAAIDLKATDLLAGESLAFSHTGGKQGVDLDQSSTAAAHVRRRRLAAARTISGIVTTVGATGDAGRTVMTVVWAAPQTGAAVKV